MSTVNSDKAWRVAFAAGGLAGAALLLYPLYGTLLAGVTLVWVVTAGPRVTKVSGYLVGVGIGAGLIATLGAMRCSNIDLGPGATCSPPGSWLVLALICITTGIALTRSDHR